MTDTSAASAKKTRTRRSYNWRVVDIVVAALIAVAGGVIFWAWSQGANLISVPVNAVYPPLTGLYAGGWMIPAVLGMLIIRKPGAALFCETVAATGELIWARNTAPPCCSPGSCRASVRNWSSPRSCTKSSTCPYPCWPAPARACSAAQQFVHAVGLEHRLRRRRQARLHHLHRGFRRRHRRRTVVDRHRGPGQDRCAEFLCLPQGGHGARLLLMPADNTSAGSGVRPAAIAARGWGWRHAGRPRPAVAAWTWTSGPGSGSAAGAFGRRQVHAAPRPGRRAGRRFRRRRGPGRHGADEADERGRDRQPADRRPPPTPGAAVPG